MPFLTQPSPFPGLGLAPPMASITVEAGDYRLFENKIIIKSDFAEDHFFYQLKCAKMHRFAKGFKNHRRHPLIRPPQPAGYRYINPALLPPFILGFPP
jgi:hypothetical protein